MRVKIYINKYNIKLLNLEKDIQNKKLIENYLEIYYEKLNYILLKIRILTLNLIHQKERYDLDNKLVEK